MARRVFFSFDYNYVWKVNQIRNMPTVMGTAAAGFQDASIWEEAKKNEASISGSSPRVQKSKRLKL